jgi:hypothetical protein
MRQGVRLEPLLQAISKFLDERQQIVEKVRRDLARGLTQERSTWIDAATGAAFPRTGNTGSCVNPSQME